MCVDLGELIGSETDDVWHGSYSHGDLQGKLSCGLSDLAMANLLLRSPDSVPHQPHPARITTNGPSRRLTAESTHSTVPE
jgi:hypothetical protein